MGVQVSNWVACQALSHQNISWEILFFKKSHSQIVHEDSPQPKFHNYKNTNNMEK